MARAYLSPKRRNNKELARVIKELESIQGEYGNQDSHYFLGTISYRLLMLNREGRHQECIQEFEKIKPGQKNGPLNRAKIYMLDIYLCAAQSYEALGKKDQALFLQELAYSLCLEVFSDNHFLVRFRKSVAKDLRDMYAQSNRMKDARNLEERCQLLGLGFDPLPKQPGE